MENEITLDGLDSSTYLSDLTDEGKEVSQFSCIIQVLFDQHLQVDVETTGGTVIQDAYVRPYGDFVYLSGQHRSSGSESVKGAVLVPVNQISNIRFRDDREYVMNEPR